MNDRYWMKSDEFSMIYDDWMTYETVSIEKTFVAKDLAIIAQIKYPPNISGDVDKVFEFMFNKTLAAHQKLAMMMFAKSKFLEAKKDFESTQNMNCPALYGVSKTMLLFYFESMIIFARNALDVAAYVYSDLIFGNRMDSFNDLIKKVKTTADPGLNELSCFLVDAYNDEANVPSALKLLCGTDRGRALRDVIIHQTNIKMRYCEYRENSEKEHLFLELKDMSPLDIDMFVEHFTEDVINVLERFNACCRQKLTKGGASH